MRLLFIIILCLRAACVFSQPVKNIPVLPLYDRAGNDFNLQNAGKDKVVFIDFWFVPCGACFAEMKMLEHIREKYKSDTNVLFLTVTLTDTAFTRPLTENRNSDSNMVFDYFKTLSGLKKFKLPVYFIRGYSRPQKYLIRSGGSFKGGAEPRAGTTPEDPARVFGFAAYPTIFIFDKKGETVYHNTGFYAAEMKKQEQAIYSLIDRAK